jgi:hypothetical protein
LTSLRIVLARCSLLCTALYIEKYDREAARYWDKFYCRNGANFFKDRHYLENEFPELCNKGLVVLEVWIVLSGTADLIV